MQALLWAYGRGGGSSDTDVLLRPLVRDFAGDLIEVPDTPVKTRLSSASPSWTKLDEARFAIPADAQFGMSAMDDLLVYGEAVGTDNQDYWVDAFNLRPLGIGYRYDREKRLKEVITPDGARVKLERDRFGRVVAWVDPRGYKTTLSYDALDRLVSVTDPEGNSVSYAYDEVGNLTSFTDARNKQTSYEYDDLDRLTKITYPDTTTEQFTYDLVGNLKSYKDNLNRTRTFLYDAADRLVRVTYNDGSIVRFGYDAVGNVIRRTERNGQRFRNLLASGRIRLDGPDDQL